MDALAEQDYDKTPYAFARNSPLVLNDPTGLSPDYSDGDDHAWNAGLVGEDVTSRPPGFEGGFVTENDMTSGTPMGGGEMREVAINSDYKEGYDKNGTIDNDVDQWEGTYFDKDNYGKGPNPYSPSTSSTPVLILIGILSAPIVAPYITVSSLVGMGSNAVAQYFANGRNIGDINVIEVGSSAVPGIGPVIVGETLNLSLNNGYQTPNSLGQWGAQVTGGILSYGFGRATDKYLSGEGAGGALTGEFFKGVVETGSNAVPNLVK